MSDPYLYEEISVLKNKLDIRVEETLALVEAELSRANMMLLYEQGFHDFSPDGLRFIHQELFGDIYDWAGQYRIINIEKRERLLAGRSVWYSNDEDIPHDLPSLAGSPSPLRKKYQQYQKEPYHPEPHYQKDKGDSPHEKA